MAELLIFAFGLKVADPSVGDLACFEGDGGRGELVRDGGLEDVEGALYVTFTVICAENLVRLHEVMNVPITLRLATSMRD